MKQHTIFWGSSYDRGLKHLLLMWQEVLERYPDAKLHICYGWDLFVIAHGNNPERMAWKNALQGLMEQKGIIHHGRIGKKELQEVQSQCGIWAYPTDFDEINCITALSAQKCGLVPVVINRGALQETVQSGIKVEGEIFNPKTANAYLEELLEIMGDKDRWEKESNKAKEFATKFEWENIAKDWADEFATKMANPLVSIITPTIREGWWNVMANNISKSTYKNIEWIVIDDYNQDRAKTAKTIAERYKININYLRGGGSLAKANNIAMREAKGELLVWLQDFILIPENAISDLMELHKRNPSALIAPVDEYWFTVEPNYDDKVSWYDQEDPTTKLSWRNIRQQYVGLRETENPMDFELNFGAIPAKALKDLGGWYEEWDEKMGYDNTEIALRAMMSGYKVLVDDSIVAKCFDVEQKTQGSVKTKENMWDDFCYKLKSGEIPIKIK